MWYLRCIQYLILNIPTVLQILVIVVSGVMAGVATNKIIIKSDTETAIFQTCILRRTNVQIDNDDPCYNCTERTDMPTITESKDDWPQEYFDCTDYCPRRTICSQKKYYTGTDDHPHSLCYNCENLKTEDIIFEFVRDDDLCPQDCSACASYRDLAQASFCATSCDGFPTFCFPIRRWFGKIIKCFRATFWYGCDFVEALKSNMSDKCKECAMIATKREEAQECANACNGTPTYHVHPKNDEVGISSEINFLKCRPHVIDANKNGVGSYFMEDLFLYDLPKQIFKYLRFSIPSSIYPAEYINKQYIPGPVAKDIFKNFSMYDITFPMPDKERNN